MVFLSVLKHTKNNSSVDKQSTKLSEEKGKFEDILKQQYYLK